MKPVLTAMLMSLSLTPGLPAWADPQHAEHVKTGSHAASLSEGVVKKVDKGQGKLTLQHGPLENLGMPAMTMIFRVKGAAMLEQVKPGDRIKFLAEKVDGAITVTKLEVVTP